MLKGILVGGREGGYRRHVLTNIIHKLYYFTRINGSTQEQIFLACMFCMSFHFRPRDGTLENCFFQMSSVHVHPRAYVCIINENSQGEFPDLGKQNTQAKKVCCQFFLLFFLACDTEMQEGITHTHTHTQRKVNHDMERKQYMIIYK